MKKRLLGLLLGVMLISVCVGCGAESKTTEPTETATATTTEESTTEQTEEPTATPAETVEPTPEATEEPSEETTVETKPETTETAEPEPTEEPEPEYTYTDMSATMFAQQTVNVRDLPDTSGNKLGSLSTNDEIAITGKCNETSWYRFEYNGSVAFVSNKYVSDNKVEVAPPANNNSGSGSEASNTGSASGAFNEADFPTPYAIINKGGLNVYFVMGPDPDMNYNAREQCIATVGANLGIEMEYHGAGTYYFFGDYYHGGSNANGVCGLFFPYYKAANGEWLGESPETQMQVF